MAALHCGARYEATDSGDLHLIAGLECQSAQVIITQAGSVVCPVEFTFTFLGSAQILPPF